ncbi:MAG: gliding motility-associated ABC transporter substrate-binding protein GldG, partial [Bacteroidota bacterium]
RFIDPSKAKTARSRNEYYQSLIEKGLPQTNLTYTKDGQRTEKVIFPGVLMTYQGRELAIPLLKGNRSSSPEEMLNESIEGLEYELVRGVRSVTESNRRKIGYIVGHGEPDSTQLAGFTNAILAQYDLVKIDLPARTGPLVGYDAIIVGKPIARFSEREKFHLDQYVMNGGSLLVFIDALSVDVRKAEGPGTVAVPYELNLEDQLFRYGIRINRDYVIDYNSGFFPGVSGQVGNQPRIELLPWPFFPIITHYGDHPMVKGLDAALLKFTSTIDTVKAEGIKKTPLLMTSEYTKVLSPPVQVRFNDWQTEIQPEFFQSGPKAVGYLLEGAFRSLYANRILPTGVDRERFKESGVPAKVVVIADGDFIRNDFEIQSGEPLPLGVDPYMRTTFANEEFVLRALSFLTDEEGLTFARNKEVKIRPLDRVRVKEEKSYWVILNTVVPVLIIALFGLLKYFARKRKYAK